MVDIIKSELAKFYSYARSFAKDSGKICPLIVDNQPVTDDLEIAELLKPQYENIFSTPRATMDPIGKESSIWPGQSNILITLEMEEEAVAALSINSEPGPDGIPPSIYKNERIIGYQMAGLSL